MKIQVDYLKIEQNTQELICQKRGYEKLTVFNPIENCFEINKYSGKGKIKKDCKGLRDMHNAESI